MARNGHIGMDMTGQGRHGRGWVGQVPYLSSIRLALCKRDTADTKNPGPQPKREMR